MLKLVNIEGGYTQGNNILSGISLEIPEGDTLAVIGQNGSGKSSIAKAIINTLPFRNGEVWLNGKNITNLSVQTIINNGIGIFLQGGKIFPHLTVNENLLFAGRHINNKELKLRITELLNYFSVFTGKKHWNLQASYLSGGQRNCLALMMVLLNKPKLLILDEPSAGLSIANTKELYNILTSVINERKITILLIEQNVSEALGFSQEMILLQNGKVKKSFETLSGITLDNLKKDYFV